MLPPRETTLQEWIDLILSRQPFAFSRWGDGEWHSVFGRIHGHNCDGHDYTERLGQALRGVLLSRPVYTLGLQPLARRLFKDRRTELAQHQGVDGWIAAHQLQDLDWTNADVFHSANASRQLDPFLEAIRSVPLLVVGPNHLRKLKSFLGYQAFVDVPPRNSFLALDEIFRNTMGTLESMPAPCLVSVSAGMPAKVLIDMLHRRVGHKYALLDVGSLLDVYAGVRSRRYMQGMGDMEVKDAS